jgi:hypothetical protein
MAVSLKPFAPATIEPLGKFLVLISVGGSLNPGAIVQLERLGKLKE